MALYVCPFFVNVNQQMGKDSQGRERRGDDRTISGSMQVFLVSKAKIDNMDNVDACC